MRNNYETIVVYLYAVHLTSLDADIGSFSETDRCFFKKTKYTRVEILLRSGIRNILDMFYTFIL